MKYLDDTNDKLGRIFTEPGIYFLRLISLYFSKRIEIITFNRKLQKKYNICLSLLNVADKEKITFTGKGR